MLESMGYRRSMFDFIASTVADPDILTTFDIDDTCTVVDAGAFDGTWSHQIATRYGASVHAFEPAPDALAELEKRLDGRPTTIHPFALGATNADAALVLGGLGSSVSTDTPADGSVPIEIRDVAAAFDDLGLSKIDLLKLNVEGSEFDIIDRLTETGWLARVRILLIQFHEWHPGAYGRRRSAQRSLQRTHHQTWDYPWIWETWEHRNWLRD